MNSGVADVGLERRDRSASELTGLWRVSTRVSRASSEVGALRGLLPEVRPQPESLRSALMLIVEKSGEAPVGEMASGVAADRNVVAVKEAVSRGMEAPPRAAWAGDHEQNIGQHPRRPDEREHPLPPGEGGRGAEEDTPAWASIVGGCPICPGRVQCVRQLRDRRPAHPARW